jgi:hypothetical protein
MIRENGEKLKSFKYLEQPCTTEISVEQVDFISNDAGDQIAPDFGLARL